VSSPFVMPSLGESVEEGVITRWLKAVGDTVEIDEPLLEVATDKVDTEIPAPHRGIVRELLAEENSTIRIGAPLAVIEALDATTTPPIGTRPAPPPGQETPEPSPVGEPPLSTAADARDGIDHGSLWLSTSPAVEARSPRQAAPPAAAAVESAPAADSPPEARPGAAGADRPEKMTRLRQTIASRMVESLHVSAQLTTVVEADVSALARLRAEHKDEFFARTRIKLSFLPFFAKATVEALAAHPMLNASLSPDSTEVTYHRDRHLGIAVDAPKGLMVPVIRDASKLSIEGLAKAIADLAERTRAGKIGPDELGGGTFTLTNTGSRGALFDTPIINQPQTGILGTGAVVDRVVPRPDGFGGHSLAVCSMVYLAITYDHRIIDGADAARFLGTIKNRLEQANFASAL
jgi:2-oxoglutarate dehydrogenase E2 component (dihydrolipoamide succinyltransferase)